MAPATQEKAPSKEYTQLVIDLEGIEAVEDKLKKCIAFLREALSRDKVASFRDFWDARRLCLAFFKEKISSRTRTILWKEYTELTDEIRKIKQILDEESSYAFEQISLAIDAIERELKEGETLFGHASGIELPKGSKWLQGCGEKYVGLQKELTHLNSFSGRLSSLRKELIQTSMKARAKNRLLSRLKAIGDTLYPVRKKRIAELSELLEGDIERFVETEFSLERPPFFALKEEIKLLQGFLKELTIRSSSFQKCRGMLSSCWEQIRENEKAYGAKKGEERKLQRENFNTFLPKVDALKELCLGAEVSLHEAEEKVDALFKEMKELSLSREDVSALRKKLLDAKRPLEEAEAKRVQKEREAKALEAQKREVATQNLLENLSNLIDQAEGRPLEVLVEKWEAFVKEKKELAPEGAVAALVENRLGSVQDHIQEKKWHALSETGGEDLSGEIHLILDGRHKEKRKIKLALEEHRKRVGGSGLSFEDSMLYQDLISNEKLRLDAIETMIEEIEEKLFDLEG